MKIELRRTYNPPFFYANSIRLWKFPPAMNRAIHWKWALPGIGLALTAFYVLGYVIDRSQSGSLFGAFAVAFLAWFILVFKSGIVGLRGIIALALFFRLLFLFSTPSLSDDYYRFMWDGRLLKEGISPYANVPADVPESVADGIDPDGELINHMNSPDYYSVYSPLNQLLFFGAVEYTESPKISLIILRVLLIVADLLLITLLFKMVSHSGSIYGVSLYAFNPLVIVEIAGNIHFEGVVALTLLASVWWISRKPIRFSAIAFGLSAGLKLVPFIYLPALLRQLSWKEGFKYSLIVLVTFVATGWWMIEPGQIWHIVQSIRLYFQTFEFNASIYYLARALGVFCLGYNPIAVLGILMPLMGTAIILWISLRRKVSGYGSLTRKLTYAGTVYLLFATTVHPWYLIPILVLAVPARMIFPWVWSALILLSYGAYAISDYVENPWYLIIQYTILFAVIIVETLRPSWLTRFVSLPGDGMP